MSNPIDIRPFSVAHVEDRRLGIYKIHVFKHNKPYAYIYHVIREPMLERFNGTSHEVERFIGQERLELLAFYRYIIKDVLAGKYTISQKEVVEHEKLMAEEKEKMRECARKGRANYLKYGHRKGDKKTWKHKKTKYQQAMEVLEANPTLSMNEVMEISGVSRTTVTRAFTEWRLKQHESVGR